MSKYEPNPADLVAQMTLTEREQVDMGVLVVYPGREEGKPVLMAGSEHPSAPPGTILEGSGAWPGNTPASSAQNGRAGKWKQTRQYAELLEQIVSTEGGPESWGSFEWLVTQGLKTADGGQRTVITACGECGAEVAVTVHGKPDANFIIKLIELVRGKATEHKEVDIDVKGLHERLEERQDATSITVHRIDPREEERRKAAILDAEVLQDVVEVLDS